MLREIVFSLGAVVAIVLSCTASAETSRLAFDASDVSTALSQVFGRSDYVATDKIKILSGVPGRTTPLSKMLEGNAHSITVSIGLSGPKKLAFFMGKKQSDPNSSSKLLAIYTLSALVSEIMVPIRAPYNYGRITVVVEAGNMLWGAQDSFHIGTSSSVGAGRDPCDDNQREKVARFTGPALDNRINNSYYTKTGVPLISFSLEHVMRWEPAFDHLDCTLSEPRAIRSVQLAYDEAEILTAEWGAGISRAAVDFVLPTAQLGKRLKLYWQDTLGNRFEYSTTLTEARGSDLAPLHAASFKGDLEEVRRLREAGINVNTALPNGWTALGFAVRENRTEVVEYLLDHGADPIMRFQYGDTALMWGSYLRYPALVEKLLVHGADGKARDMFGNNLFSLAVHGRAKSIESSFSKVPREDLPIVKILIAKGLIDYSEATMTALQIAAEKDHYRVIKALVDSGFNPEVNVGDSPLLIWAVKHGYTELAATVLANGAPVNVENKRCETPLLAALSHNYIYPQEHDSRLDRERKEMVALLLRHGAKPMRESKNGINAFKAAESLREKTRDEVLKLLNSGAVDTSKN